MIVVCVKHLELVEIVCISVYLEIGIGVPKSHVNRTANDCT